MVTSSPRFSKKPRSSAIGIASMSIALTMPTFSFVSDCDCAGAQASASAAAKQEQSFHIQSSLFYRPHARHPVRPGNRVEVRSFDTT